MEKETEREIKRINRGIIMQDENKFIAVINGRPVTMKELEEMAQRYRDRKQQTEKSKEV